METDVLTEQRKFLFLQGPHGPFFGQLATKIAETGSSVERIGFNRGDSVFWRRGLDFIPYHKKLEAWPHFLEHHFQKSGATDVVLYGDSRPIHKAACEIARRRGITVHCFEEGYLRPYWATYERGGTNGNSRLMGMDIYEIRRAVERHPTELSEAPAQWGAVWHHVYYGFLYHLFMSIPSVLFRKYRSHRQVPVRREVQLYLKKLLTMPLKGLQRRLKSNRLLRSGAIYHLVLLQLSHDASLRSHSDFNSVEEFISKVIRDFADAAPPHHMLVFKAHPFEDGREPLPSIIRKIASEIGVSARVIYIPGGKLGPLLDSAKSAVTVNSTAAQQALWRNLPVKALGRSVFSLPQLVSQQTLKEFFTEPDAPDADAYQCYRKFLLETSQVGGGFYTQRGRSELLRRVVDLMLAQDDPYSQILDFENERTPELQLVASRYRG